MRGAIHLAAAAAATLLLTACGVSGSPTTSPAPTPSPSASGASDAPSPSPSPAPTAPALSGYLPLYPFTGAAEASAWQASYRSGGHQPWHLSADLTALAFTQGYLGFPEVSRVAARAVAGGDALVTVGLTLPSGQISHAAIIHLIKFGAGRYAPWEVVGTDDTTLTLDLPAYGATLTSPVRVGGKIAGVDENLRVEVRVLGAATPVGSFCCLPAGGQSTPWSAKVSFHASAGQVMTVVVHTGGHVAGVERFAVTGVRAG